jgi:alpha-amylase/alpha-mannosidase (GH57 family)
MPSNNRYLVVHGHFYQPPRENPWIESVEVQDSAAPYHDWNARITAECYARNGASRVVDQQNQILAIVNNYAQMSFNFGPTLLSWLQEHAELTYQSILEADKHSAARFSGHGSAMAQVYNHIILPLASRRDKELQVLWGIADFEHRFARKPEGMWLAETAVDTESLEVLAENGIRFTVLAPIQCAAVRALPSALPNVTFRAEQPGDPWVSTSHATVDTRRPYQVNLPSGRSIAVFFYDGPRSRAIAFEHLLDSGVAFAQRLAGGFSAAIPDEPELVHVATDGESYGHHHRYGEMALSYALQFTEEQNLATLTNYAEFLALFPPTWEAAIAENTSWSCAHGIERWRSDCGCNGGKAGWNQRWRAPLRAAFDAVRDGLAPLAQAFGTRLFKSWPGACDRYIHVVLCRDSTAAFLQAEQSHPLSPSEQIQALKLLELLRHTQLMYTSCGWFFDDIAGIETVQIIAYATRALELASSIFPPEATQNHDTPENDGAASIRHAFLAHLGQAISNVPAAGPRAQASGAYGSGADIYYTQVCPLKVGLEQVAVHFAVSSVFRTYPEHARVFAFAVENEGQQVVNSGRGRLVSGRATVRSTLTHEQEQIVYAVLHFGDQNIAAGVKRTHRGHRDTYLAFIDKIHTCMLSADFPSVIRLFDQEFDGKTYTIRSLFTDEQRRVIQLILDKTIAEAEQSLIRIYEDHASLLHFLSHAGVPPPTAPAHAANFSINLTLRRALETDPVDLAVVRGTLAAATQDAVSLDQADLSYTADQRMRAAMLALAATPADRTALDNALALAEALRLLPFPADLWQAQNLWHQIAHTGATTRAIASTAGHFAPPSSSEALETFRKLGLTLNLSTELVNSMAALKADQ